jgi:thioredoxin-related protein
MKTLLFGFVFISCMACNEKGKEVLSSPDTISWTDINKISSIDNVANKMFFIDLYTEWCGWCKTMDKKTFADPVVAKKMNQKFHCIKFNAEQKESINFNDKKYEWQAMGRNGVNTLAIALTQGNLSYPAFAILNKDKELIKVINGFKEPSEFLNILDSI